MHHWLSIGGKIWKFLGKKLHAALHYARIAGYALHRNARNERMGRILREPRVFLREQFRLLFTGAVRNVNVHERAHARRHIHMKVHFACNKDATINVHDVRLRCKLTFFGITLMISNEVYLLNLVSAIGDTWKKFFQETYIPISRTFHILLLCSTIAWERGVYTGKRVVAPSNQRHKHFVLFHSHRSVPRV